MYVLSMWLHIGVRSLDPAARADVLTEAAVVPARQVTTAAPGPMQNSIYHYISSPQPSYNKECISGNVVTGILLSTSIHNRSLHHPRHQKMEIGIKCALFHISSTSRMLCAVLPLMVPLFLLARFHTATSSPHSAHHKELEGGGLQAEGKGQR